MIFTYRWYSAFPSLENLDRFTTIQTKENNVLSIGRAEGCVDRSGTNELVGSNNRIGVRIVFNDSDGIGRSSLTMASALALDELAANSDVFRSIATTFEGIGSLEPTRAANLCTGKDMTVLWRECDIVDAIEL